MRNAVVICTFVLEFFAGVLQQCLPMAGSRAQVLMTSFLGYLGLPWFLCF